MSGTRKMEKFEVDALAEGRANAGDPEADLPARPFEPRTPDPPAPPPPQADAKTLEHVLAGAAAEARAARVFLGSAAAALEERSPSQLGVPVAPADVPVAPATVTAPPPAHYPHQAETPVREFVPAELALPETAAAGDEPSPSTPDALRTRVARKFVSLADSVTEAFKDFAIGAGAWSVELTVPPGMSTGGGKQALQHIRCTPRRPGYNVFVAGTVNQVERRADLRDFDHVAIMHEVRHRGPLDINLQEWEQFLRKTEAVLNGAGIQSMRTPPPRELLDQRRAAQRISKSAVIALVVVAVLALAVIWRVVLAVRTGV